MHFPTYIQNINKLSTELSKSISLTVQEVFNKYINNFDYQSHITGLLLGNIQSGKTSQVFGIISEAADKGFNIFIFLTTDINYLHKQTYERALSLLDSFNVCNENDDIRFKSIGNKKPAIIIIKKNTNILKKWLNILSSSRRLIGSPLFIIDDEGDAASLNILVNRKDQSKINKHLESIVKLSASSIYLQVTATPQSIILQSKLSSFRPSFIFYFPPGGGYLGGDFFYSDPKSFVIKIIEDENQSLNDEDEYISEGLRKAILSFLISSAHILQNKPDGVCNLLIHPSSRINDHSAVAQKVTEHLNLILNSFDEIETDLLETWTDLQKTQPNLLDFQNAKSIIYEMLENESIKPILMNSRSPSSVNYSSGTNIIIGGNSLGRGITFPGLQTVYYSRRSKTPNADSYWQHCRMFGYDRIPGLLRVFIPDFLLKLFIDLNNSNQILIEQIKKEKSIDDIHLLYPDNVKPTRKQVIDKEYLQLISGGVNYFPYYPNGENTDKIDFLLNGYSEADSFYEAELEIINQILALTKSKSLDDWNNISFLNILTSYYKENPNKNGIIIVRRNRDIKKDPRTLLSEDDRKLGDTFVDKTVLTLYRITGSIEKGWLGQPLWIPNIKLPEGLISYKMNQ